MSTDGGGLRKRRPERTSVDRTSIRDTRLSFRALGVLLWLLDRPDGWAVRADQMAKDGKRTDGRGPGGDAHNREGREAIRTALHELGAAGYYRLERRRMLNGEVRMGTAISEDAVPQWAEQDRYFAGDAVPVVEQADGSFLVLYPDGSLLPDDFDPPPTLDEGPAEEPDGGAEGEESGDRGPETRFRPNGASPGPRNPAPGKPAPGNTSPLEEPKTVREKPCKEGGHAAPLPPLRPQDPPTSDLGNEPSTATYERPGQPGDLQGDHRPRAREDTARTSDDGSVQTPILVDQVPRVIRQGHGKPSQRVVSGPRSDSGPPGRQEGV